MPIPSGIILPWNGTNASIPAGWERETSLDSKFVKAWSDDESVNTAAGSDTHSHTSPTHNHTMAVHQHTANSSRDGDREDGGGSDPTFAARDQHEMQTVTTTSISGGTLSSAITYAAVDGKLPYYEVVFIKPSGAMAFLTNGFLAYYNQATEPTGWKKCDGNNSTPDLTNRYLRGAATGGDAGGVGGATTHTHTVNHTHAAVQHQNVGYLSNPSDGRYSASPGGGGGAVASVSHTHSWTSSINAAENSSAYSGTAGSSDTIDLFHTNLMVIANMTGGSYQPIKMIGMSLSATPPRGWRICDGTKGTPDLRGTFIKVTNTSGIIGTQNTVAANAHTHAASNSHTHTASGTHYHPQGGTIGGSGTQGNTGASGEGEARDHTHAYLQQTNSVTSTWNATTIQADSTDHQPAYRTVAYMQLLYVSHGIGGMML